MSCQVKCGGFDSVRSECARDPCLANQMCKVLDASISDCSKWCCKSRSAYVFFIVFFFCLGTFTMCAMYYLHRLHQTNVQAGAVTEAGDAVEMKEPPSPEELAKARRQKRNVNVDPELMKALGPEATAK